MISCSMNFISMDKVCNKCGSVGFAENIVTCSACKIISEHSYCMQKVLRVIPKNWHCDICTAKSKNDKRKAILLDSHGQHVANPVKRTCLGKRHTSDQNLPSNDKISGKRASGSFCDKAQLGNVVGPRSHPSPLNGITVAKSKSAAGLQCRSNVEGKKTVAARTLEGSTALAKEKPMEGSQRAKSHNSTSGLNTNADHEAGVRKPSGPGLLSEQTTNIGSSEMQYETTTILSEVSFLEEGSTVLVKENPAEGCHIAESHNNAAGLKTKGHHETGISKPSGPGLLSEQTTNIGSSALPNETTTTTKILPAVGFLEEGCKEVDKENHVEDCHRRAESHNKATDNAAALNTEADHEAGISKPSGQGLLSKQTTNVGSSALHNDTTRILSAVGFLGNTTPSNARLKKRGCQNNNSPWRSLLVLDINYPWRSLLVSLDVKHPHHPVTNACWNGNFKIFDTISTVCHELKGIQAHVPGVVNVNVYETMIGSSGNNIWLKLRQRVDIWPKRFQLDPPDSGDIGLYFFPSKEQRLKETFKCFVDMMDKEGLAMQSHFENAELLILTSAQLPQDPHIMGIVPEVCLWGVFRRIKPNKQITPNKGKLPFNSPSGNANSGQNHGSRCSFQFRAEGTAIARTRPALGPDAPPGLPRPIYRNQAQRERQQVSFGPIIDNRATENANSGQNHSSRHSFQFRAESTDISRTRPGLGPDAPPGFPQPIYRNQAQLERQAVSTGPVIYNRDAGVPPSFFKPIYPPIRR